ncbi:hypothetical protein GCK72_017006 [Caenorhabditis remanei]|uniref:Uncharacterized protein n=1 Tax=Caenorhabditis remanei TaxID=31234 RepID=A0A6A5G6G1_CAERE|nr:hypothetical protein GCK72_017006 [Caenorhabditis remanei]KAF1750456.1 hypothetical protein GCK72_017006 [Caenorhabditis remanei]
MVCVLLGIMGLAFKQFHKERSSGFWSNWSVGLSSIGFPSGSEAIFVVYNFVLTKNTGAETHQARLKRYAETARKAGIEFTEFSARCGFCLSVQALKSIENWKKEVKKERRELRGLEKLKPELREANIRKRAAEGKLAAIENITRDTEERLQREERGSEEWMELHTQAMNNIREVLHNPAPATTLTEYFEMGLVVLAIAGLAMKQFKKERSDCIWTNLGVALSSIGFPSGSEAVCVIYSFLLRKSSKTWRNGAMWFFIVAFLVLSCFSSDPSDPSLDNYMTFVFGIILTDVLIIKLGKVKMATNIASGLLLVLIAAVSVDATYWHLLENIPLSVFDYRFPLIACAAAVLR